MASYIFIDTYEKCQIDGCDLAVIDAINLYINKEISTLTDGLLNRTPVISADTRNRIAKPYAISPEAWNVIKKSPDFKYMDRTASDLKLGLIISWCRTRMPIFLTFFMILDYSSLLIRYFEKGYSKPLMRYTIANADNRTDFKKYDGSLLKVCSKKVESFIKRNDRVYSKRPSDRDVYRILQDLNNRMKDTVKTIANKYYTNFKDPKLKVLTSYEETDDGKALLDNTAELENIRIQAVDMLSMPSVTVLNAIGLTPTNVSKLKYRKMFIDHLGDVIPQMSELSEIYMSAWMHRNRNQKINTELFRKNFVSIMIKSRAVQGREKLIQQVAKVFMSDLSKDELKKVNKYDLDHYIANYVVLNLYVASTQLAK